MKLAVATSATPVSDARRGVVDAARQQWIRKLIDLSRRNNLLYFRQLKTGTLDLSAAPGDPLTAFFAGASVPISKLFDEEPDRLNEVVRAIARRAFSNFEERGLQTLFVALGIASWPADDGGRVPESSILLLPVGLNPQGRGSRSFTLARTGPPQINLVLLHFLDTQFGVSICQDDLLALLNGGDESEAFDPGPLYSELAKRCRGIKDFSIRPATYLGNFAFQKMAMVRDLQERGTELAAHDLIAAIAGDDTARSAAGARDYDINPRELDKTPPDNEFFVLDADSSQQCAVDAVLKGENGVIHGPPGTGKSQTIVNLIAGMTAAGKRVLFVAEKRAALNVVFERLKQVGLDHLAMDLHGADISPKRVLEQVGRALDTVRASMPVDCAEVHSRTVDRRNRLDRHVERLHCKRSPASMSVYQLQGRLMHLQRTATAKTRWREADLARFDPQTADRVRDLLKEAGGYPSLFLRTDSSPWTGVQMRDGTAVHNALDLVTKLDEQTLPRVVDRLAALLGEIGLNEPQSVADARAMMHLLTDMQETLNNYSVQLFGKDLTSLAKALRPGSAGWIASAWAYLTSARYRGARRAVLGLRINKTNTPRLYSEVMSADDQLQRWRARNPHSAPMIPAELAKQRAEFDSLWIQLEALQSALGRNLEALSFAGVKALVASLASDRTTPYILPKLGSIERELDVLGASPLVRELREFLSAPDTWVTMFDFAWFASTLDAACEQDPEIRGFRGRIHSGFVEEFVDLDEARIELAAARVRRVHGELAVAAMNAHHDQELLIRSEIQRSRKRLPLRKLFAQASDVLTAVCPCWMASPLSVSQLLDGGRRYFDVVVFDEASQVLPEDAVCAVLRGAKLVVAGDRNQLPPTTFFAAGDDDLDSEEEAGAAEGFESLLDLANAFLPSNYLDWHYRSRDESLIAFSNHHIYRNRLITFPGPGGNPAISHVLVTQQLGTDGEEDSCGAEVQRAVELALEHARRHPQETLGIITMGIKHRDRVQRALDKALQDNTELDEFFDDGKPERCFVKNLESVQGDERDAIIISVGYGKDRAGNLPFRFGPLIPEGGRRRLNVAVTRARQRLTIVSSFSHLDMDLKRVRPGSGVELLRNYLEYAASSGKRLGDAILSAVAPNDFEQDIQDALEARGLRLIPQLGSSQYRIDIVAEHPRKPGRYVLAIECDGATYHSSNTARDRDRLRQHQLEALGWRFHRIWSTDWFMHKSEEVERAMKAFDEAVEWADRVDAIGTSPPATSGDTRHSGNGADHNAEDNTLKTNRGNNRRSPRPLIPQRSSITEYTSNELIRLISWVTSDGQLRTDDEVLKEMIEVLGFRRRGARIESRLRQAIEQWRRQTAVQGQQTAGR